MRKRLDSPRAARPLEPVAGVRTAILPAMMLMGAVLSTLPQARADMPLPAALVDRHCNACHAVNDRLIGPPLLAVAARYGADADPQRRIEVLAEKIRLGGAGNWGIVPMVPNTELTTEEARALARLVLALKPQS